MLHSSREHILVIGPRIPRPDMHSGDLRLSLLLKAFAERYEVVFLPTESAQGDRGYAALLEADGIRVEDVSSSLQRILLREHFSFAILEFFFTGEYYLDRLRILAPACRVIVDSVDVHYLRLRQKYRLTMSEADFALYRSTKKRELAVYRKADAVITVTAEDASALAMEGDGIRLEVIPNIHDLCPGDLPPEKNSLIFVGGFAHTPNTDAVLYFCSDILPSVRARKPDVHFTIVGSNPPEQVRHLAGDGVAVTGYVPRTTPFLHRSAVSVAPLRYGAGMKGKIGEAMAHGIPVVTTSVGAEGMGLTNRRDVLIEDTAEAFAAAVVELLDDPFLYGTIRRNALEKVAQNYTRERVGRAAVLALERIGRKRSKRMRLVEKVEFFQGYLMQRLKQEFF